MKKPIRLNMLSCIFAMVLVFPGMSLGDPRAQTIEMICGKKREDRSEYVSNFISAMENISTQIQTARFAAVVTVSGNITSYGLGQCYGDLSSVDCLLCYSAARNIFPQCFPYIWGRLYLDGCFMRIENYNFFHDFVGRKDVAICGNRTRESGSSKFLESVRQAVMHVVTNAPGRDGYARAEVAPTEGATNDSAYALANCWRTVDSSDCKACLEVASRSMLGCLPASEGRALYTGCFIRYSDRNFLNPVPQRQSSRGSTMVIVVVVISIVVTLVVGGIMGLRIYKHQLIQKKRRVSSDVEKMVNALHRNNLIFKYSTLDKATESFNEANKLGQGGFGTVYKGTLPDGREIAVKRLYFNHKTVDFYNEVNIISRLEHKNLVRLLGCSCSGPESLLVYEFLPHLSLDTHIFNLKGGKALKWEKRYEIMIEIAEGLIYLHGNTKTKIVHRDIKASNILLDWRMRAKIADFGLARAFHGDRSHISTTIVGTL